MIVPISYMTTLECNTLFFPLFLSHGVALNTDLKVAYIADSAFLCYVTVFLISQDNRCVWVIIPEMFIFYLLARDALHKVVIRAATLGASRCLHNFQRRNDPLICFIGSNECVQYVFEALITNTQSYFAPYISDDKRCTSRALLKYIYIYIYAIS